uniref:CRAL/TRIO N-terminal domain-containing protein n=1 Tax=Timema douglasi TaxID=61478 RepID=A0A7R8VQR9_TIMDO|nr:unnamed protein product [Timema douglasi]
MASLVLTDSSQLTYDSQHLALNGPTYKNIVSACKLDCSGSSARACKIEPVPSFKRALSSLATSHYNQSETDLNVPLDDGNYLYRFLRPCKFYPDSALDRMKKFYRFRLKHPELAANISPVNERNVFEQDLVTILPKRTQCGRRIMVIDAGTESNPFQTHCFPDNLDAPGVKPGTSGPVARTYDH